MSEPELCRILYLEEYLSTMATFRDFLHKKTYSAEALALTEQVLGLLASHYTAWQYRFDILVHLQANMFDELDWCELVALENEKNYQIWNYRQRIIEYILADDATRDRFDHRREFPIINMMLEQDCKNHHVWSYRKWFVERFSLFDDASEAAYVEQLIDDDVRNNSAWTHRFFLKFSNGKPSAATISAEIEFAQDRIDLCPQNASSWNYLTGIYAVTGGDIAELKLFCLKYADTSAEVISSSFALELLAKIAKAEGESERAKSIYTLLAEKYDPIRANYWAYLSKQLDA